MKVRSLSINNFMAVGEIASLPLDDKGLILIQGNNEDDTSQTSNGAGKSTIAEALCWALYGVTARGDTGDAIVNDVAKKNTAVVVELVDDAGDVYRVSRYRKHKTFKNMLRLEIQEMTAWKDLTKGNDKLTQELVNRVIGCTHEVFSSAIYAGQEAMPDLPGMTDKQLKELIEEAAGINELQQAHDVARRHLNEAKLKVSDLNGAVMSLKSSISVAEGSIGSLEDQASNWSRDREERKAAVMTRHAEIQSRYDPTVIDKIEKRIAELNEELVEIADRIAGSDGERATERSLSAEHQRAVNQANVANVAANNALKAARDAKHSLDHIEGKLGTECDSCGHVLGEENIADARALAKKSAVEKAREAKQLRDEAEAARVSAESAHKVLLDYRASMTDVSELAKQQRDISDSIAGLKDGLQKRKEMGRLIDELARKAIAIADEKNPHLASIETFKERLDDLRKRLEEAEAGRDEASKALTLAEEAVRVFGPAGVRAHILDTVTPHLNARTSHYLSALTDGNITAIWSTISSTSKGELREKFSIDVSSSTGAKSFKGLSGGEKRKVRLACAMALQDLVASRASKPIRLFIADEIDHALDGAGLERLMVILDEKSREKGTVLVISHSDLRDFIRTSITITKKGGQSYLEPVCL